MKLEYVFLAVLGLVLLIFMVKSSVSLESGNTMMSGLIDPFFDFLKSIIEAIFGFFGQLFGGLFS